MLTRETGGTPIGARIREILHDTSVDNLAARAEALLTAADRAQHLAEVVIPALDAGRTVVTDRSVYSSLAYQGYGRGSTSTRSATSTTGATGGVWPDVVVFLDPPDDTIAERHAAAASSTGSKQAGDEFHARVLAGFRTMAGADPDHWITVRRGRLASTTSPTRSTRIGERGVHREDGRMRHRRSCPGPHVGRRRRPARRRRAPAAAAEHGAVHAYLFVGPAGSTKLQAARAFAARCWPAATMPTDATPD